jgi:cytochrome c
MERRLSLKVELRLAACAAALATLASGALAAPPKHKDAAPAAPPAPVGNAAHGAEIFKGTCGVCHLAQPHPAISDLAMRIGPNLWNVVGRKAGSTQHFRYSAAMIQSGIVWTPDKLRVYIHQPQTMIPNIRMSFQGLKNPKDADDVVAYLETFR